MTATLDQPTRPTNRRRQRRRRQTVRNLITGVVVLVGIAGFLLAQEHLRDQPAHTVTAVAFEPRPDTAGVASQLDAQVARAIDQDGDLILVAILDGRDGVILETSFACEPGGNRIACENLQSEEAGRVEQALEELLATETFPTVSPLSALQHIETRLVGSAEPPQKVEVVLNLTGRHVDRFDLDGYGAYGQVDKIVAELIDGKELPDACDGWQVHIVAPSSGDLREDRAWEQVFRGAVRSCGGELVRYAERWPSADGTGTLPPPPDIPDVEDVSVERDVEKRQDTYRLEEALFDVGSAKLRTGAEQILDSVATYIARLDDDWSVEVIGSADSTGHDRDNLALSENRAQRVADGLLDRLKATVADDVLREDLADRFKVEGIGSLPDDGSAEQRQANRRVDVVIHHVVEDAQS